MSVFLFEGILVLLFGIIIGSFLNVVSGRINTGIGLGGRSKCETCATTLKWFELVPVLSFLVLRGKCRTCTVPLSLQYPVVELSTGLLFLISYVSFTQHLDLVRLIAELVLFSSLIVIVVYDTKHMVIPQKPLVVFVLAALVSQLHGASTADVGGYLVGGLALFAPFYILWRVSDGRWIGLGDADLAAGIGLSLGLVAGFAAIAFAFIIGGAFATILLLSSRGVYRRREVPFAPFLLAGFIAVYCIVNIDAVNAFLSPILENVLLW